MSTEQKHTPGKWAVEARGKSGVEVRSDTGTLIAHVAGMSGLRLHNAERIVASVNACAGVATDDLYETMLLDRCDEAYKARTERDALRAEVERLREALNRVLIASRANVGGAVLLPLEGINTGHALMSALEDARAILNK